ncbi:hypothetical protein PMNALOAF_2853 [Methylobacterium adhaesivum]|jgi:uncharacterized small protein (DUF1192 family)|uniref:DUF1192 domain-containing protein n=1 Tax=Methylobacterium adhaesivum TaxID=333297 RepID=A0ABT8BAJ6_9HYPH|nr:DUF1192 domain-containing protein [Methylobacterium adhaesivum]MDN3589038.1 DUF1192 domain-containing protein [Methylobacterium adhaesivum]GJD31594.1 hypothetical protein PMNALOAF_2853 [Methylobacterium adhaesivum]
MRDDDESRPTPAPAHRVGEPLDTLSVAELSERIVLLQREIVRLEAARDAKSAARDAAGSLFRL